MTTERRDLSTHLTPEELDLLLERDAEAAARVEAHLDRCLACRREAAAVRHLHHRLAALPRLETSPGFAQRVMARVRLPVPWYVRVWAAVRERLAVLTVVMATVGVAGGAVGWWLLGRYDVTLGGLAEYGLESLRNLVLEAVIGLARLAYEVGAVEMVAGVAQGLDPLQALAILGALGAAGLTALFLALRPAETTGGRRTT